MTRGSCKELERGGEQDPGYTWPPSYYPSYIHSLVSQYMSEHWSFWSFRVVLVSDIVTKQATTSRPSTFKLLSASRGFAIVAYQTVRTPSTGGPHNKPHHGGSLHGGGIR